MTVRAADPEYAVALEAIAERGRFGVRLGLGPTRALLRRLGDPQLALRGALVGGTNGKGSVLALAGSALRAAGYRVGETPKPHLVTYRERIQVDRRPITPDAFARLARTVLREADAVARRHGEPTEFELLTAMMFLHLAERNVDVALVEVGLGGRLDATNVWDGGVAAITNVALDHTDVLGPTVEAIAREKAAIISRGDLAVTGAAAPALGVIRRRARRLAVPLTEVVAAPLLNLDRDGIDVALPRLGPTRVGLRGRHQAANVAVADAVLDALATAGIAEVGVDERQRGYASATWPGRLELIDHDGREILLDGAHNPAGATALAVAFDDLRPSLRAGPPVLVTAMMGDKDVAGIVTSLAGSAALSGALVVCTSVEAARALPAQALADRWSAAGFATAVAPTPEDALELALAREGGPIVVAGSLYLVGALRARLVDDPDLIDPDPGPRDRQA